MSKYKSLWQHIKSYKFNSIFIRNFLILMFLLVIPLSSLGVGVYVYYYNMLKQEMTAANNNSLVRVMDLIDMVIRETDKLSVRVASDPNVTAYAKSSGTGIGPYEFFQRAQEIFKTLDVSTITSDYIDSIYVYSENSNFILSSNSVSDSREKFIDMGWISSYQGLKTSKINSVLNARTLNSMDSQKDGQELLSSVRGLPLNSDNIKGAVIVNINADILSSLLDKVDSPLEQSIFIIGKDRNIYFSTDHTLINTNADNLGIISDLPPDAGSYQGVISDQEGEKQIVSMMMSGNNQLYYVSIIPLQKFEEKLSYLKDVMFGLIFASIIMTIAIALIFSLKAYQPIKTIISILEDPGNENLRQRLGGKLRLDELKFISKSLIERSDHSIQIEKELGQRMIMLKKSQSIALQSQINPHFLYNTLETINWMAMSLLSHKNPISSMLTSLSQLLRLSLETEEGIIPVRKEIEHAKCYLEIQQARYSNKFVVEWDISEDVLDEKIVKITFQPLLENAIYHGIKPSIGQGRISIKGYRQQDYIIFEVEDNGVGIDEEALKKLNEELSRKIEIKEDQHIGIMNVNLRLKLAFGDEYGLVVHSTSGGGTRVVILFPAMKDKETK